LVQIRKAIDERPITVTVDGIAEFRRSDEDAPIKGGAVAPVRVPIPVIVVVDAVRQTIAIRIDEEVDEGAITV
jgi:hypothetical protein